MDFVSDRELVGRVSALGKVSYVAVHGVSDPNRAIPPYDTLFNSSTDAADYFSPLIGENGTPLVDPHGNLWFVQTTDGLVTRYIVPGLRHK
jgi:hypothetical protein